MADSKIVREWLEKADEDFGFASANLTEENQFYAQICFHFHQAAEKYLKAFIVCHDLEFKKTHDLINLLTTCSSQNKSLSSLMTECENLNTAYLDTRYPVHWPTHYTKEKALEMRDDAERIAHALKKILEGGA
jgi:HEPN domain-containing protein